MNPKKWEEIIYLIEEKFGLAKHQTENFLVDETHDGQQIMGQKEIIEFRGPMGQIRVEKISQPKLIDKKVLASRRIGGKSVVDYVYSPEEKSEYIKFYRLDPTTQQWNEIKDLI